MYKFRLYSKSCEHVVRVIEYMVSARTQDVFLAKKICTKLKIPEFYTRKGLQTLSRLGVLKSIKGPGGGYQISDDAGQLSVLEIIQAVDGKNTYNHCVMGISKCNNNNPCAIHDVWADAKKVILGTLASVSLRDLNAGTLHKKNKGLKIKHG